MIEAVGIILLFLIFLAFLVRFGLPLFISVMLNNKRKLHIEVPEQGALGWWSNQENLEILTLKVELDDQILNLLKNQTILRYTLQLRLKGKPEWRPSIQYIHCSECFLNFDPTQIPFPDNFTMPKEDWNPKDINKAPEAEICLTPVVKITHDPDYQEEVIELTITNERRLGAFHYGENAIRIRSGTHFQDIIFCQKK